MTHQDDAFVLNVRRFFSNLASNPRVLAVVGIAVLVTFVGILAGIVINEKRTESSQRAFFDATKMPDPKASAAPLDLSKLQKVAEEHRGTIASLQAALLAAKTAVDQKQWAKAEALYVLALGSTQDPLETAAAHYGHALALAEQKQFGKAAAAYEKCAYTGESSFKGRALLGWARMKSKDKDNKKAKELYEKILMELPNTPEAATAEIEKASLGA